MTDRILTVGIDAGHGGPTHALSCDSGGQCSSCGTKAGARHGIVEGAYNRAMADALHDALPADLVRAVPLAHHLEDVTLPMRAARAVEHGCDLVLSLHVNESSSPSTSGAHMMFLPSVETEHASEQVALSIAKRWPVALARSLRPRRTASGVYVAGMVEPAGDLWPRAHSLLRCYQPTPTVLVEMFYASCDDDCAAALRRSTQLQMLGALVSGIGHAVHVLAGDDVA